MSGIRILGTGMFLPETVATNEDFAKFVDTSDEWIRTRTGIEKRHIADVPTWYMGAKAAEQALEDAGLSASELDLILLTTVTSDFYTPSLACMVQRAIGAEHAACMDLNAACAAFVYAMDTAAKFLTDDHYQNILIVSCETLSRITDYSDRSTCVLFGDGAGACVVTRGEGLYAGFLASRGVDAGKIFARVAMEDTPFTKAICGPEFDGFIEGNSHYMHMDGRDVYKFATKAMPEAVLAACKKAGIDVSELDLIIPHQANIRIVETAVSNLGLPPERFYVNVQNYGNTSSASIPICLNELRRAGRLHKGMKICMVGFGAGLVYAACVLEI